MPIVSGTQLRSARTLADLEQAELARRAGISVETVRRIEQARGDMPTVRPGTLERLELALFNAGILIVDENGEGPGCRRRKYFRQEHA